MCHFSKGICPVAGVCYYGSSIVMIKNHVNEDKFASEILKASKERKRCEKMYLLKNHSWNEKSIKTTEQNKTFVIVPFECLNGLFKIFDRKYFLYFIYTTLFLDVVLNMHSEQRFGFNSFQIWVSLQNWNLSEQ